jgi:AraC-like DNA-binding protein
MNAVDFQKSLTRPLISLSSTRAAYVGPSLQLSPHKNAVATVAIGLNAPFKLTLFEQHGLAPTARVQTNIALIAPNTTHYLKASGAMIFIYLDALSHDFAQLNLLDLKQAYSRLIDQCFNPARANQHMVKDVDVLCAALGLSQVMRKTNRLAAVIHEIDQRPQEFERMNQAACMAGVSVSRFQHLFKQSVGMPFRRYRLWRRVVTVMH